jgi:hypothetical protein
MMGTIRTGNMDASRSHPPFLFPKFWCLFDVKLLAYDVFFNIPMGFVAHSSTLLFYYALLKNHVTNCIFSKVDLRQKK